MNLTSLITLFLLLAFSPLAQAKMVQILHTNDLHSYFEGTRAGLGGYARLKTMLDQLRADASAKGIPTLHLDAGDFGEGSSHYFSNQGVDALKALDLLGVDTVVLGNHDYMFGYKELRRQLQEANLKANILSANILGKGVMGIKHLMPDFVDYHIDGVKIRIFGLSTTEVHFQYPLRPLGFVSSSHRAGIGMAQKANREGVDFLIALTHTGIKKDELLVSHSMSVDLVVGGHDHLLLSQPKMVKNKLGRAVPVLQAGSHGIAVGSLLIDIQPGGKSTVIDYRIYEISPAIKQDPELKQFTSESYLKRDRYFNRPWNEVIGFSEITLTGNYNGRLRNNRSCWSRHMARLTRLTAKADLGLQWDVFQGEEIPPGPLTFGDMVDNFPHVNKWGDQGWSIAKARVPGFIIKKILHMLSKDERLDITIDGLYTKVDGFDRPVAFDFALHDPEKAMLYNEAIESMRYYSIGLPSEIPFAMLSMARLSASFLLGFPQKVPNGHFWPLLENYIQKNSPLRCLQD